MPPAREAQPRRKPRRQAPKPKPVKRSFQSGEAARAFATARRATPAKAATFKRIHAAPTPRPRPTPAQTRARSVRAQRAGYVSQGKMIGRQAVKQRDVAQKREVKTYLDRTPEQRRQVLKLIAAKPAASRSRGERRIQRIHKARHEADVKLEKQIGFVPRIKYGYTPKADKLNVMPVPKHLERAKAKGYLEADPKKLKAAGFHATSQTEKALTELPLRAVKDAAELVVTTPTSLVKTGETAIKEPTKLPGQLIEPYKQVIKDPVKAITQRPVSTALLFAPGAKIPGLAAGKVARVAGKQTLRRPDAILPGTTIRQARTGSRSIGKRARQAREDAGKPPLVRLRPKPIPRRGDKAAPAPAKPPQPQVGTKELRRRVDEFYDWGQQHKAAATEAAARDVNKQLGGRRKAKRAQKQRAPEERAEHTAAMEEKLSGARGGAHQHVEREFAKEFGSDWKVVPGVGGKPAVRKFAPGENPERGGVIHESRADAEKVAKKVPFDAVVHEVKGETEGVTAGYAVVPRSMAERFRKQKGVGTSPATGAVVLRVGNRAFRKTVLPVSTKWLGGQVTEGALRSAVMGAGPTSRRRYKKVLARLEQIDPKAASALKHRTASGGQFGVTGPASEFAGKGKTFAEEFEPTGLADQAVKLTKAGALPGVRHARKAYKGYTNVVFNHVNGRIEQLGKQAMTGRAIKQGPLMERRLVGLSDKAIDEAAQGLRNTSSQVELGRAVDRAYGKYSKYGPAARETILHTTPFVPWFRNMVEFLGSVMPKDHPVLSSLTASMGQANEEWRKANRLSYHGDKRVPDWMMGAYPKGKDKFIPVGRFGPFTGADIVGDIGSQIAPQYSGMLMNMAGVDWKGQKIPGGQGRRALNVGLTGAEALVPGVGVTSRVTGIGEHYVRGKTKKPSIKQGKKLDQAVLEMLNPIRATSVPDRGSKKKKAKRKGGLGSGGLSRGGLRGGGLSGGGVR